ncbi:DUF3857 domain-containing protein, partial [Aquimarina rubra]
MGKLHEIVTIVFLIVSTNIIAQEYKFGKVSKEELLEESYKIDSVANAVILYENKKVSIEYGKSYGFQLVTEVFKRVKLYDKNGFDYASEEVFLYKQGGNREKISNLKGATYSYNGNKIVETKLKKEGIFKNEYSENLDQVKFTMPSLQEGSVIEYKYKITSPFLFNIDKIYLQQIIPIKKLDVKVKIPEYFNFKKMTTGYLPINLKESSIRDFIVWSSQNNNRTDYGISVYKINSVNVPAFKEEPFSGNINNYISSINYELSYVKLPNRPIDYRSTTWEDVAKTIYKSPNFGDELKRSNYYQADIDKLLNGVNNQLDKTVKIYDYVKKKITWNKRRGVFTNTGTKKAYKENTGSAAEINLMLTSMLIYAGIDANPVICSTSDKVVSLFPTIDGFNYVISRVKLADGDVLYLDATDKYGVPNVLPDRIIQGMGRVIAKNGTSQMVDFRPLKPSVKAYRLQCEIDDQAVAKGRVSVNHKDYLAHNFRVVNAVKDDESKAERFEKKFGITELDAYTVKGVNEYGKGVSEQFDFTV